jgi:hypothetical protein
LHVLGLTWICNALWALDILWSLSNVSIISLNPFIGSQVGKKAMAEDSDIIEKSTGEGPIDPNNVSSQDTESYFISKSRLHCKLVGGETWSKLWHTEICAINSNKTVIALVLLQPIVPNDLCAGKVDEPCL